MELEKLNDKLFDSIATEGSFFASTKSEIVSKIWLRFYTKVLKSKLCLEQDMGTIP